MTMTDHLSQDEQNKLVCNALIYHAAIGTSYTDFPPLLLEMATTSFTAEDHKISSRFPESSEINFYHQTGLFTKECLDFIASSKGKSAIEKGNWNKLLGRWNQPQQVFTLLFGVYNITMKEICKKHLDKKDIESSFFLFSSMPYTKMLVEKIEVKEGNDDFRKTMENLLFDDREDAILLLFQIQPFNTLSCVRWCSTLMAVIVFLTSSAFRDNDEKRENPLSSEKHQRALRNQLLFMAARLEQSPSIDEGAQLTWWCRLLYCIGESVRSSSAGKRPQQTNTYLLPCLKTIMTTFPSEEQDVVVVPPFSCLRDAIVSVGRKMTSVHGICAFLEALSKLFHNSESLPHEECNSLQHVFDRSLKLCFDNQPQFSDLLIEKAASFLATSIYLPFQQKEEEENVTENDRRESNETSSTFVTLTKSRQSNFFQFFATHWLEVIYFLIAGVVKRIEVYDPVPVNKSMIGKAFVYRRLPFSMTVEQNVKIICAMCVTCMKMHNNRQNQGNNHQQSSVLSRRIFHQRACQVLGTLLKFPIQISHPESKLILAYNELCHRFSEENQKSLKEAIFARLYSLQQKSPISTLHGEMARVLKLLVESEINNNNNSSSDILDFLLLNFINSSSSSQVEADRPLPLSQITELEGESSNNNLSNEEHTMKLLRLRDEMNATKILTKVLPDTLWSDFVLSSRQKIFLQQKEQRETSENVVSLDSVFITLLKNALSFRSIAEKETDDEIESLYNRELDLLVSRYPFSSSSTFPSSSSFSNPHLYRSVHPKFSVIIPLSRILTGLDLATPDDRTLVKRSLAEKNKEKDAAGEHSIDENNNLLHATRIFAENVAAILKQDQQETSKKLHQQLLTENFFKNFLVAAIENHCIIHPFFQVHDKTTLSPRHEDLEMLRSLPDHFFAIIESLLDNDDSSENNSSSLFALLVAPFINTLFEDIIANTAISNATARAASSVVSELSKSSLDPRKVETNRLHLFFRTLNRILTTTILMIRSKSSSSADAKKQQQRLLASSFPSRQSIYNFFKKLDFYSNNIVNAISIANRKAVKLGTTRGTEATTAEVKKMVESRRNIAEIKRLFAALMEFVFDGDVLQVPLYQRVSFRKTWFLGSFGYENSKREDVVNLFFRKEV